MTTEQELTAFCRIIMDYPDYEYEITDDVTQCYPYEKPVRINLNRKDLDNFSEVVLFDLLHEIGHAMNEKPDYARCVREYNATVWAIKHAKKYGIQLP